MRAFWRKGSEDLVAGRTGMDLGVCAELAGDANHVAAAVELVGDGEVGRRQLRIWATATDGLTEEILILLLGRTGARDMGPAAASVGQGSRATEGELGGGGDCGGGGDGRWRSRGSRVQTRAKEAGLGGQA